MNFTEVKSILESIADLVKKGATLDLQEKIVNLRDYIIALKEENISLKEENHSLKGEISAKEDYNLSNGLYLKVNDPVPFCQKCLDDSKKPIHLQRWGNGGGWKCLVCSSYYDPRGGADARVFIPDHHRNSAR